MKMSHSHFFEILSLRIVFAVTPVTVNWNPKCNSVFKKNIRKL